MISVGQLAGALNGVRLLLKLDARALEFFDKTPRGFLLSFLPAALLAPLHITHAILVFKPETASMNFTSYVIVQTLSVIISVTGFPFAMIYVSRLLGRFERYFWYMVPYNWFQLVVGLMTLPLAILATLDVIPREMAGFFSMLAITLFFTYGSFIARIGLQIGLASAIGLVVLDLVLMMLINQIIGRI